jgi:hypothetical protein
MLLKGLTMVRNWVNIKKNSCHNYNLLNIQDFEMAFVKVFWKDLTFDFKKTPNVTNDMLQAPNIGHKKNIENLGFILLHTTSDVNW